MNQNLEKLCKEAEKWNQKLIQHPEIVNQRNKKFFDNSGDLIENLFEELKHMNESYENKINCLSSIKSRELMTKIKQTQSTLKNNSSFVCKVDKHGCICFSTQKDIYHHYTFKFDQNLGKFHQLRHFKRSCINDDYILDDWEKSYFEKFDDFVSVSSDLVRIQRFYDSPPILDSDEIIQLMIAEFQ